MAGPALYNFALTLDEANIICAHLKSGVYVQVVDLLNKMALTVQQQNQAFEQAELQAQVAAAAASLPAAAEPVADAA